MDSHRGNKKVLEEKKSGETSSSHGSSIGMSWWLPSNNQTRLEISRPCLRTPSSYSKDYPIISPGRPNVPYHIQIYSYSITFSLWSNVPIIFKYRHILLLVHYGQMLTSYSNIVIFYYVFTLAKCFHHIQI